MQGVVASVAKDAVIAVSTVDSVIALPAIDNVAFLRTAEEKGSFGDIGFSQRGIIKLEAVTVAVAAGEIVLQCHLIVAVINLNDEIVAPADKNGFLGTRSGKAQGVGLTVIRRVIAHSIVTVPLAENVSVAEEAAAFEEVIP